MDEIEAAYKRMLNMYPAGETYDTTIDPQGFRLAYETLMDPEKRKDYDFFLEVSFNRQTKNDSWDEPYSKRNGNDGGDTKRKRRQQGFQADFEFESRKES